MEVICPAKTKPYLVVEVEQSMMFDFQSHLAPCFKRTCSNLKERMRVRDARMFEYSRDHSNQVWVKYSLTKMSGINSQLKRSGPQALLFLLSQPINTSKFRKS